MRARTRDPCPRCGRPTDATFAEPWAHYLHMVDTLETARSYGLALKARPVGCSPHAPKLTASRVDFDDFDELFDAFVPLTVALNSLNRSMGLLDPYPFVLSEPATQKLAFVHELIEGARREERRRAEGQDPAAPEARVLDERA